MGQGSAIEDFDDPDFNPFIVSEQVAGQGAIADIYTEIRRLRAEAPVHEIDPRLHFGTAPDLSVLNKRKIWVLAHKDVQAILTDPAAWPSAELRVVMEPMFGETITQMDAPDHRRYRALFQQAFAPNMLQGWREDLVPRIVDRLIDKFIDRGGRRLGQRVRVALSLPVRDGIAQPAGRRSTDLSQAGVRADHQPL